MAGPVEVLRAGDLPVGSVTAVRVGGRRVAVVHCASGFYALDDECTHQGGPLGEGDLVDDCVLRCPWHGARFDVRTGEVLDGPAARPARTHLVTVEDGLVTVALDEAVDTAAAMTDPRAARRARLAALRAAARTGPEDHEPTTELTEPAAGGPVAAERTGTGGRGRVRGRGQWAMGHYEPLNDSERIKRDQDGLDVYERIVTIHARRGVGAISGADRGTRYRWYGLYTQRPEEDGFFMMRVRVPSGVLSAEQVEAVGRISQLFGHDVCDVTDRQNFQFHWIRIEDVPQIWARLGAVGLTTRQTCGDVTRNIIGCPLAGIAGDEIIDATPYLVAVDRRLTGTKEFSNLPRKYKISISGCREQCALHEVMDIGLVGVEQPDGGRGFDLWVGGGLGPAPHFGRRLGAFVPPERVVDVCAGITGLFRDYGYRRDRHRARLKFLMADWGPARVRQVLEQEYLQGPLQDGPAPPASPDAHRDHLGVTPQCDGRLAVGFAPMAGRISGTQLVDVARLARRFGRGRLRTTTQQKMLILDVAPDDVGPLIAHLDRLGLPAEPSALRAATMACSGIEFCKLAVTETKHRARGLVEELERRLPGLTQQVRINLNGCPNSCARFQLADIGLQGALVPGPGSHERVEGFLVQLGGHLGDGHAFGRKISRARVPATVLPEFIEQLVRDWLERRRDGEDFATWVQREPEHELQALVLAAAAGTVRR